MKEFNVDKPKAKIIEGFSVDTWVEIIYARWHILDEEQQYYFCDKDKIDGWLRNGYGNYYEHSVVTEAIEKFLSVESDCIKDL